MDERLRRLERGARGGDQQAEARELRERERSGGLPSKRLELAAYLGNEAARAVVGSGHVFDLGPGLLDGQGKWGGAHIVDGLDLVPWTRGLMPFGAEVGVRAACAAVHIALSAVDPHDPFPQPRRVVAGEEATVRAVRNRYGLPAEDLAMLSEMGGLVVRFRANHEAMRDCWHRQQVEQSLSFRVTEVALLRSQMWTVEQSNGTAAGCDLFHECDVTGEEVGRWGPLMGASLALGVLRVSGYEPAIMDSHPWSAITSAHRFLDPWEGQGDYGLIQRAIKRELTPWALGRSDPIADRLRAREARREVGALLCGRYGCWHSMSAHDPAKGDAQPCSSPGCQCRAWNPNGEA